MAARTVTVTVTEGNPLPIPQQQTNHKIASDTGLSNGSFHPSQEQTSLSYLVVRVQSLTTSNEQLSNKVSELEKRNLDLEQKVTELLSTFGYLLQFQNTQDQSELPLYQIPVVPIQSSIENNSTEDTPPPGFSSPQRTASDKKVASAKYFLNLKDYFCAGAYIDDAIQIDSENAKAFAIKSKICRLQGDASGSLQAANKAIEIDPKNLMALVNKALASRFLGRIEEALMASESALSLKPRNQLALRCKLECQFILGRHTDSLQTIESTLQRYPNDPTAMHIRGLIFHNYPHLRTIAGQQ